MSLKPTPARKFLQLFRAVILTWPSRKLTSQMILPKVAQYKIQKTYTIWEKSKSREPNSVLVGRREGDRDRENISTRKTVLNLFFFRYTTLLQGRTCHILN